MVTKRSSIMQLKSETLPLISVVLPTYNGSRYLEQSVESVLAQTHAKFELIIVDDASRDSTPEIIANLVRRDGRIIAIRHDENSKLPGALNSGFQIARGAFLTWTSDDNMYRPDAFAEMLTELQQDATTDLVYADFSAIAENGDIVRRHVRPPEKLVVTNAVGPCFLYRRAVYDTIGSYDTSLFLAEDYDYWIRAAGTFRLRPLHKDLYLYRLHAGSLTAQRRETIREAHEQVLLRHLPGMGWAGRKERANGYLFLADLAINRHEFASALGRALAAARLAPGPTRRWVWGWIRRVLGWLSGRLGRHRAL